MRFLRLTCTITIEPTIVKMKTITTELLLDMLQKSIEEPIESGDTSLTKRVVREPMFLVQGEKSAIVFSFGWDTQENFNVLSLN